MNCFPKIFVNHFMTIIWLSILLIAISYYYIYISINQSVNIGVSVVWLVCPYRQVLHFLRSAASFFSSVCTLRFASFLAVILPSIISFNRLLCLNTWRPIHFSSVFLIVFKIDLSSCTRLVKNFLVSYFINPGDLQHASQAPCFERFNFLFILFI